MKSDRSIPTSTEAITIAKTYSVPFTGPCAAYGKVVFVDIIGGHTAVYQIEGEHAEMVFCGNAYVAAAAICALEKGTKSLNLSATDGNATVLVENDIKQYGLSCEIQSTWHITPRTKDFSMDYEPGEQPVVRVQTLNDYSFSVGLPWTTAVKYDSCRSKHCRITPGTIPEIQVSSCGRIHGAAPQTAMISLQLARYTFPIIRAALPTETIKHPSGLEQLPTCHWECHDFVAVMPPTNVEIVQPVKRQQT